MRRVLRIVSAALLFVTIWTAVAVGALLAYLLRRLPPRAV